jgi:hypothetical protein
MVASPGAESEVAAAASSYGSSETASLTRHVAGP